jgi:predicted enzyme related to lactoylglutathione lyase
MQSEIKLAGVIIWTQNFEKMSNFYIDVLGLNPKSLRENFINFEWQDLKLSISVHENVTATSKDPFRIMINLELEDIFTIYNDLLAKGVEFIRKPEEESWGLVASFYDPDHNIIQLIQNHKIN